MNASRPLCLSASLLLGLALSVLPAGAADRHVNPDGLCGGNVPCYTDLQSAIDASGPGDVIHVQAGLYIPAATVDVTVPVRILGPMADNNPLPSKGTSRVPGSASEAIVCGAYSLATLMRISASDVEVNGLEFRWGTGDLLETVQTRPTSGGIIRNNIIHGSSGDEGMQLRNVAGALIECNHVYATAGDGINLCCGSTDGIIRWNEVHDIGSENAAVYVYSSNNTTIEGNLIYNTTLNEGIKLGAKYGPDSLLTGGTILNNKIHDTRQDGIAVYTSRTTVRCNEVYNSHSENGGIYLAYKISDVAVIDNRVHDNAFDNFKWGDPAGIMIHPEVYTSTVTVRNNSVYANSPNGMTNKAADPLVAEGNWWGAADGPGPVGPGSGDRVSADVDYDPWLASPATYSCPEVLRCGDQPTPVRRTTWGSIKGYYR
jgi:hypothetical protein